MYTYLLGIDPSGVHIGATKSNSKEDSRNLLSQLEGLPACRRCHRSDKFVIGSQDFREEIEARER